MTEQLSAETDNSKLEPKDAGHSVSLRRHTTIQSQTARTLQHNRIAPPQPVLVTAKANRVFATGLTVIGPFTLAGLGLILGW